MVLSEGQKCSVRQFAWLLWLGDPKETFLSLVPAVEVFILDREVPLVESHWEKAQAPEV